MILITGANRGLGAAMLAHYRGQGADVVGTSRQPADGLWPLDVADAGSIAALARRLGDRPLKLLISNAGTFPDRHLKLGEYDAGVWTECFATNATGPFLLLQALLENLKAAAPAKVALIATAMASQQRTHGGWYAYRASKAALINIGRNIALDLAPMGISVGIYHPGSVQTRMSSGTRARLDPAESAAGLVQRFEALGPQNAGCFEAWDGKALLL